MTVFRLGLTGSIGMGKSTTAQFFGAAGYPVWDADAAVHRLYGVGGAAVAPLAARFPQVVINGAVSRPALKLVIANDSSALKVVEEIVHPLVAADRTDLIATITTGIVVLDIPLLFEIGLDTQMDATLLVTAPPAVQRARVMARPGMTDAMFQTILSRQMPDAEKRKRATHVVETLSLDLVQVYVTALIAYLNTKDPA